MCLAVIYIWTDKRSDSWTFSLPQEVSVSVPPPTPLLHVCSHSDLLCIPSKYATFLDSFDLIGIKGDKTMRRAEIWQSGLWNASSYAARYSGTWVNVRCLNRGSEKRTSKCETHNGGLYRGAVRWEEPEDLLCTSRTLSTGCRDIGYREFESKARRRRMKHKKDNPWLARRG